jgi:hypothetical protein
MRAPVHTFYVAADRLTPGTVEALGAEALRLVERHGGGWPPLAPVRDRVTAKLEREPVEDLRVDFEDGYGERPDDEEDGDAARAGAALAGALDRTPAPAFAGIRVKPAGRPRGLRTLERFLGALLDRAGTLPDGFVVTLAKAGPAPAVAAFADALARLEGRLALPADALRLELQIETAEAILDADGRVAVRRLVGAAGRRCAGVPFGPYDYTAALDLDPSEQRLDHPACDFARRILQVALAGTGLRLSDGGVNAVPASDESAEVHRVWDLHAAQVRRALRDGYWQGWDLHPAHLPPRFAATFAFLLDGLDDVRARLAGSVPGVLDEPATLAALRRRVQRAVDCGAAAGAVN